MQWILWTAAIALSVGAGYWVYRADRKKDLPFTWLGAVLRALIVFLLFILLIAPELSFKRNETKKPIVLFLQDNSSSIKNALGTDTAAYIKHINELKQQLAKDYTIVSWGFGATAEANDTLHFNKPSTNIAGALSEAQEYFSNRNLGAIILASDGRYNEGANPLYQQLSLPCSLYSIAIGDSSAEKDLKIGQTYYNKTVSLKSEFEIRADLLARLCKGTDGDIELKEGNKIVGKLPLHIGNDAFDRTVSFWLHAEEKGLHHYTLQLPIAAGEKNSSNNQREIYVEVSEEKKKVLIVFAAPHPDVNAVKEALSESGNYTVTLCAKDNIPANLQEYSVLILHGLPSLGSNLKKIEEAHKPVWYMVSKTTDGNQLNQVANPGGHLDANLLLNWHDVSVELNNNFTLFSIPRQLRAVIDKMPPMYCPGSLINIRPDIFVLLNYRGYANTNDMPVWMMERGSLPKAMLLAEGLWRWRLYEYKNFNSHEVIDELIRQTVAYLAANANDKPFRVIMQKNVWSDQERVTMDAILVNANNEAVNDAEASLTISDSAGHKQNFVFERSGTGYKLNIGILGAGTYSYTATAKKTDKSYTVQCSFAIANVPLEMMETGADYALLSGLAKKYKGALIPAAHLQALSDSLKHNNDIKPIIETINESISVIDKKWIFFLILLIALGDWLLRKYYMAQ